MKRPIVLLMMLLMLLGLSACAAVSDDPAAENNQALALSGMPFEGKGNIALRIVDGADSGKLVLAGAGANDVFVLPLEGIPIYLDGKAADAAVLEDGMIAELDCDGIILESYPARFGKVNSISVYSLGSSQNPGGGLYDLCGLYLQVLNDLWDTDSGLNGGANYISVDLSAAPGNLTEGERAAIAWIFAGEHQAQALNLSYAELAEQGYLTEIKFEGSSDKTTDDKAHKLYEWEDGLLFSISAAEWQDGEKYSLPIIKFNANKWRTPLGAYFFCDCKAIWPEMGSWETYSIGSEAIS